MFAKKNLIAVAALATLAVSAQAQSSVTLYGNVDVAVGRFDAPFAGSATTAVESSGLTESFFGLKGQEDLGGGLKAIFKLESAINVDNGTQADNSRFFGKNAYIGLSGDFGTVTAGRQESLFKKQAIAFNPLGASLFSTTGLAYGLQNNSWSNTLGFESANYGGLSFAVQHSFREGGQKDFADSYNGGATVAAVNYAAGALALSAVYGDVRTTEGQDSDSRDKNYLLGASYDFGVAKAFAQYGKSKVEDKAGEWFSPTFYQIGAIVPVTAAGSVHVSYGQTKDDGWKNQAFALAYNHNLSKRTAAYAAFDRVKRKFPGNSDSANSFAVGVRHAF